MTHTPMDFKRQNRHRIIALWILCLFGLCLSYATTAPKKRAKSDERIYLNHADELRFDQFGTNPGAQIVKGRVSFRHDGSTLTCDSAYFYQASNSVEAFGHVRFHQADTLSLTCDYASYDGMEQMLEARRNVVLKHRKQTLYTDSLNYDRLYGNAYFFEGGTLVDGKDRLVSDWGTYNTETRQAEFYYHVRMRSGKDHIDTDTLYYDTRRKVAHIVGPSTIHSKASTVKTTDGYYDSRADQARLFSRSTIADGQKTITGDTLFYVKDGNSQGFGNVIYVDHENKNTLHCGYLQYNEATGYGLATKHALAMDYSQGDTLFVHADTMKIQTFNINTDSVYRKVHAFPHMRAFRTDIQAVCDSMVFSSLDSCMTMYRDPIVWNGGRQLLGEVIKIYMNDSTVRQADVVGQALSVELMPDSTHYNQIASTEMRTYFNGGKVRMSEAFGNVQTVYFPISDRDSSLIGLNYTETDTLRMYMSPERKLERIWMPKAQGTLYPMTQIPPEKRQLPTFAWFDYVRPLDKDDVFKWRGKAQGSELKKIVRHSAPLQQLNSRKSTP